jgi:sodium pump decarboxylase gamma subunit
LNPMMQGLTVGVMGIGITFAALGLIILVMIVLQRLFVQPHAAASQDEIGTTHAVEAPGLPQEEEVVAAIGAALAYMRAAESARGGLGSSLGVESGAWWHVGQAIQHSHGDASSKELARLPSWREPA